MKRSQCGDYLEIDIFPVFEKQRGRSRKRKPTSEVQKRLNQHNAERKLTRLLNTNFTKRDIRFDLTYDKDHLPDSPEDAQRQMQNFIRRVKRYRQKHDLPELELFQKAFIQTLFGWLEKETGYRRFRETMFLCGRKNGKSTLLSGIALYMLIADYEGAAEIYSVATKKDQAKKVLTEAVNMIKQSPELRAVVKKRRNDVYFPATSSIFEALASDSNTLDGLNSHAVIIDELHAIRDRNLYEVMKQSTSSRRQPLVVMITTAGTVRECIFDNMYELAWWKNNSFTPAAIKADEYLTKLKTDDKNETEE